MAVVPLQTHGCYNACERIKHGLAAVVPLQTHGCYNPPSWNPAWRSCLLAHVLSRLGPRRVPLSRCGAMGASGSYAVTT